MKGISVKCPECHAPLEAGADTREVRCSYCGTLALIQRRTRILQRPAPLPARPPDAPEVKVATEESEIRLFIAVIIGSVLICALIIGLLNLLCNQSRRTPWSAAVLADVNGDMTLDMVALMRDRESEALTLAAFAGQSGKNLWWSDELPKGQNSRLCTAGDLAIYNNMGPALNGVNLADGELRWEVRLDEAVARLCSTDDPATVLVVRSDKQAHLLSLADGGLRPAAATSSCKPLPCAPPVDRRAGRLEHNEEKIWEAALPGMDVEEALRESGITLALGFKTPGSAVPMIARVESPSAAPRHVAAAQAGDFTGGHGRAGEPKVLWQTPVPAQNPLEFRPRNPGAHQIAVGLKSVAVAYESNDRENNHLTLFSLAEGQRRFNVRLPKKLRGISSVLLTPELAVVTSAYGVIAAFDVKSGEAVYTIE